MCQGGARGVAVGVAGFVFKARIDAAQARAQHQGGHVLAVARPDGAHVAFVAVLFVAVAQRAALGQVAHHLRGHVAEWLAAFWRVKARQPHLPWRPPPWFGSTLRGHERAPPHPPTGRATGRH